MSSSPQSHSPPMPTRREGRAQSVHHCLGEVAGAALGAVIDGGLLKDQG